MFLPLSFILSSSFLITLSSRIGTKCSKTSSCYHRETIIRHSNEIHIARRLKLFNHHFSFSKELFTQIVRVDVTLKHASQRRRQ